MLKPSQLSCIVGALLVITGTAAIAAPTYQYRSPAHGLAPAQVQAPPPVVLSSVGDGISKAGACATGAATGCATWDASRTGAEFSIAGNRLTATTTGSHGVAANKAPTAGKWYWEISMDSGTYALSPGVTALSHTAWATPSGLWSAAATFIYSAASSYNFVRSGVSTTLVNTTPNPLVPVGAVVGIALDLDNQKIQFYRNGSTLGSAQSVKGSTPLLASGGQAGTATANFGQAEFKYPVPAGYNAGLW